MLVWLGVSGSIVGALIAPFLPGGWWTLTALGLSISIPLTILVRGFAGAAYPSARTRLFALRPFWYTMLFLPLLAISEVKNVMPQADPHNHDDQAHGQIESQGETGSQGEPGGAGS